MKSLFEKMRDNRRRKEQVKRRAVPDGRRMTFQEAQESMNRYRRDALDGIGVSAGRMGSGAGGWGPVWGPV